MVLKLRKIIPLEDRVVTERGHKGCCWIAGIILFLYVNYGIMHEYS